ncbi:CBS and PB1 domain protein, partial [Dissophora ornata]
NPFCVTTDTNATEALNKMVNGGFRHLPCLNADGDVVGLLDITKCLYEALEKLDKAHKSSRQLVEALEGMQADWAQAANPELRSYVDIMRDKMASPDLNVILEENHGVAEIHTKTSVREASRAMKQVHATASLIMEEGRIAGIFTTKDIVVRVLAAGLEPDRTSVIRVMTRHPDTVKSSMTILDALKKMHDNHYLHLPVVDELGHMAGLVDVLQVSLAMLSQMNTIQGDNPSEGPVWSRFWETSFNKEDTGSEVSASDMRSAMAPSSELHYSTSMVGSTIRLGSVMSGRPGLSSPEEIGPEFVFKFKDDSGQVHRFSSSTQSFKELHQKIVEKIEGLENGRGDVILSYCDEENDQVLIVQDSDVVDAVRMASRNQWPLIRLSVTTPLRSRSGSNEGRSSRISDMSRDILASIPLAAGLNPAMVAGGVGVGLGVGLALVFALMKK